MIYDCMIISYPFKRWNRSQQPIVSTSKYTLSYARYNSSISYAPSLKGFVIASYINGYIKYIFRYRFQFKLMFVPSYHDMKCLLTVIGLYVQIIRGFSQQCENKDLTILAKTQTPSADFKPIFTTDHIKFGVSFQNCFHHCDTNDRCIGFEVCQVNENLYRCRGCCEWRKRKKYDIPTGFSMCTFYGKVCKLFSTIPLFVFF